MKNSNDIIGNRTHDLSACNAVPQPSAPLRAPILLTNIDGDSETTGQSDVRSNSLKLSHGWF